MMIRITIPELEYRMATVYNCWSNFGRAKALELDAAERASFIELDKLDLHNQFIEDRLNAKTQYAPEELI